MTTTILDADYYVFKYVRVLKKKIKKIYLINFLLVHTIINCTNKFLLCPSAYFSKVK